MAYVIGLAKGLKDEDPETRVRVANALMALEDPRATLPLVEALGDSCEHVRRAVARALSWVGDDRARPAFIKALREEDFSLRFWAAIGLQKVGDKGSVESLLGALKDPDEGVRLQAIYALAEIRDRRAVDPLIEVLDDEDTDVQEAARDNLRYAFGIVYDPEIEQSRIIPEKKTVEFESLPIEEQRRIKRQLQVIYEKIEEMEQIQRPVRDDKLYDALYEEHGIRRIEASQHIGTLLENRTIFSPKPGYYAIATPVHDKGTKTKQR